MHFLMTHSFYLTQLLNYLFFKCFKSELQKLHIHHTDLSKISNQLIHTINFLLDFNYSIVQGF
jgi:hypothetical protein